MNLFRGAAIALITAVMAAGTGAAAIPDAPVGVWRNQKNSVHIRIAPCGPVLCGTIVWANEKAKKDAREGGTDPLVGTRIFKDLHKDDKGRWRGKVFVPDINMSFSGTVKLITADTINTRGCLFSGIFCKSRVWVRVS
ncbi:DUF2147 domain-containing protein [Sphingosinicella sp. GR2756]|uniref:DUF2147 domain-containing protein n=2 Tax=Sphingosinicella rhizophila TaxID=3050082 RepID=A0ABU3Q7N6_9SPHN|nr:DUF2147 domain-containing protein [Sphingosinicella sp. GR2756]